MPRNRILTLLFAAIAILMPFSVIAQSDGGGKKKKKKAQMEQTAPSKKPSKQSPSKLAPQQNQRKLTGTINGYEWVDLGLPSGVKWATCNVGASSPSDYGSYFAWGETSTKSEYTTDNSKTYNRNLGDISGNPSYDAARANWGGSWRLPTKAECQELVHKCKWTWTTSGGHDGYKVTGPNGSSIFLPAGGWRNGTSLNLAGSYGYYWSSSPDEVHATTACHLYFYSSYHGVGWLSRYYGQGVRPVVE